MRNLLHPGLNYRNCTTHRFFIASINLIFKYLSDYIIKIFKWAHWSITRVNNHVFGFNLDNTNLMERYLLKLLNWNMQITEKDLYNEFKIFLRFIKIRLQREIPSQPIVKIFKISLKTQN